MYGISIQRMIFHRCTVHARVQHDASFTIERTLRKTYKKWPLERLQCSDRLWLHVRRFEDRVWICGIPVVECLSCCRKWRHYSNITHSPALISRKGQAGNFLLVSLFKSRVYMFSQISYTYTVIPRASANCKSY